MKNAFVFNISHFLPRFQFHGIWEKITQNSTNDSQENCPFLDPYQLTRVIKLFNNILQRSLKIY